METEYVLQSEEDNILELTNVDNIDTCLLSLNDKKLDDELIKLIDMTSLKNYSYFGYTQDNPSVSSYEDKKLKRLSLAYEKLHIMPKLLLQELAMDIKILDISHNEFENLNFLTQFKEITTLICDHNKITSTTILPYMPNMEFLWLNYCKITELIPWAKNLQKSCPNIKYLSLMGNPVIPSIDTNLYNYLQYRFYLISLFPNLLYLDDKSVNDEQRKEAEKLYHTPIIDKLINKNQLPNYFKQISDLFSSVPSFTIPKKNVII